MWINFAALKEPFGLGHIDWRVARAGEKDGKVWARVLAYLTARAIQDRLDNVCGPENWRNEYDTAPGGGVLCGISIRCGDEWITKWDGASQTDIEAVKGGLSAALKRAAVQWGIGRYLYDLDEGFAHVHVGGRYYGKTKAGKSFRWDPPNMPSWALPDGQGGTNSTTGEVDDGEKEKVKQLHKLYHLKLVEHDVSEIERKAYQDLHPDLPHSSKNWGVKEYQQAIREIEKGGQEMFLRAAAKHEELAAAGELPF